MRFYHRLADPSLAGFLHVFRRRLKAIYDSGVRVYDHFEITDQFTVQMRIQGDILYVNIDGGGEAYFEFQTSGYPGKYGAPHGGFSTYRPEVIGVTINVSGSIRLRETILGGEHVDFASSVSKIKRPNQVQLADEPAYYPGPRSQLKGWPDILYESYAPLHSHTGVYQRAYHCNYLPFYQLVPCCSVRSHKQRDTEFDATWATTAGQSEYKPAYLTDSSRYDWPRASGLRTVEHQTWGKRKFGIIVDAFDQVHVFPVSEITEEIPLGPFTPTQNVADAAVQTQRVTFPAWVFCKATKFRDFWNPLDAGNTGLTEFPEIDWKLHPDGTHICAVVHERVEAVLDTAFFNTYAVTTASQGKNQFWPDANSHYALVSNAMGFPPQALGFMPSTISDKWYHVATGLLEVEIDIDITGPNPEDFTLSLITIENRRPTTSPYCTFVAGYVWYDIEGMCDRGDLIALDIECYGDPVTGLTAQLWSVKNLSDNAEIMTFGAASTHIAAPFAKGKILTEQCMLLAYNIQTLSFLTKDQALEWEDFGADRYGTPIRRRTMHFGLSVRVMGRYRDTLFPSIAIQSVRDVILDNAKNGDRARLMAQYPGLQYMPLNDLRGWGDADLDSLREDYARDSLAVGPYVPGFNPLINWAEIETKGHLYWKTTRDHPPASATANRWYNDLMGQNGIRPFPMFYVTEPRPGWYMYMRQVISKIYMTPETCFFTHPSGTWALFDQSFIYNANPVFLQYFDPLEEKLIGSTIADLQLNKLEHCIFDKVHFEIDRGRSAATYDTTFLKMYNNAVTRGLKANTLKDDSETMKEDYSNLRAAITVNAIPDSIDPSISYAEIQIDWYNGFRAYIYDTGYFNGKKDYSVGFDSYQAGNFLVLCMGGWWQDVTKSFLIEPQLFNGKQIKFSTCTLITT